MATATQKPIHSLPASAANGKPVRSKANGQQLPAQSGDIDMRPMIAKITNNWYWIAASVGLMIALSVLYVKISPNIFAAHTTLLLSNQSSGSMQAQELLEILEIKDKGIKVEDEIGLIKSHAMVQKAMERLDFAVSYFELEDNVFNKFGDLQIREKYKDYPFRIILNPAANQFVGTRIYVRILNPLEYELTIDAKEAKVFNLQSRELVRKLFDQKIVKRVRINKPFQDDNMNFKLVLNPGEYARPGSRYFFVINDLNSLTNEYLGKLEAKVIHRDSRILDITSEGPIIEKELKFLNTLVDVVIENDLDQKNQTGLKTLNFLDGQLSKIGDSLRNSKSRLSSFRSTSKLLDVNDATTTIYQKLDQLESEKSRLNTQIKYYQNVLSTLNTQENVTDIVSPSTVGIENPLLSSVLVELLTLNRQLAAISVQARKDAPNVRTMETKIESAKSSLLENLRNNISASNIAIAEVDRRIGQLEGEAYRMPENERRLLDLQGRSDFNSKNYERMLEKRAEAAVTLASNMPDKKRVDEARMIGTGPQYPKSKQIYLIAAIIGLVIPIGLLLFADKLDNSIRTKEDLEGISTIPVLGVITDAGKSRRLPVVEKPLSAVSESIRSLRINLQYLAAGMDKKVIGVTSSISGEGKSFCASNIAAEIAMSGKRVALLEVDMRRPTMAKYFNLDNKIGLSSYLIKSATLNEVRQQTEVKGLDVILSGPIPPNPVELISLPAMAELIDKLKDEYDYVVLDIPPISFVAEYFVLVGMINANLFITRYKYTSKQLLNTIEGYYQEGKIEHLYLVLNGMNYYQQYEYRNTGQKYYRGG